MDILIAEDDGLTRLILGAAIEQLGHTCLLAEDGAHAWEIFQTRDVDVVISDRLMPGMDGLELCRRIRAFPKDRYTYFIFLTGLSEKAQLAEGMQSGADDYLIKPHNPDELQMRLSVAARMSDLHHQLAAQRLELEQARLESAHKAEQERLLRKESAVRHQINRDLHDGPTQLVAAISMHIEVIKMFLRTTPERVEAELNLLSELVKKTFQDLRTLLFELRPLGLETHGLIPTLEEYSTKFRDPVGMQLEFNQGNFKDQLAPQTAAAAFMIIQEAINNARKHAGASTVWIDLAQAETMLIATIRDNGVGFDLSKVRTSYAEGGSFGLLNMHERAALLGGTCTIHSTPGAGTQVSIQLPLDPAPPDHTPA